VTDEETGGYRPTSESAGKTVVDEHDPYSAEGQEQSASLSNIRHKLRTPLNHLIGYSEMLLEEADEQQLKSFVDDLNKIHTAGKQPLLMINDLLDPAGSQAAHAHPAAKTADPAALFRDIEPRKRPLASDQHGTDQRPSSRLLVVDDNEGNRDMLSRRLRHEGYTVETAEHGRKALAVIKSQQIDLVLLDVMMPEMNGYEVLEQLQADRNWRDIPVIMISALDEIESVVRCIEMGAEDYLPKPFNPVLLRARVTASLEKKRLRDIERLYAQSMEKELEIGRKIQSSFFPDLFFGILDPETGVLSYINAGHEPLIVVGPGGVKEELQPTGPAVGMVNP